MEKHPWIFEKIFDGYVVPKVQEEGPEKTEEMIRKPNKYMPKKDREARKPFRDSSRSLGKYIDRVPRKVMSRTASWPRSIGILTWKT